MAINCETKKRIIAYFTSIICGPFANDYSLPAYGDCRVWWAKVNEECKDLSGQHLLSVMALVLCIKCLVLLLSPYPVFCIWLLVKNVFGQIYCTEFIPSDWATLREKVWLFSAAICLHDDILVLTQWWNSNLDWNQLRCCVVCVFAVFLLCVFSPLY